MTKNFSPEHILKHVHILYSLLASQPVLYNGICFTTDVCLFNMIENPVVESYMICMQIAVGVVKFLSLCCRWFGTVPRFPAIRV